MTTLNAKWRANFEEWLDNIADKDLDLHGFANRVFINEFGSKDFILVHTGISTGDPKGCHMIQAKINNRTKDRQLLKLLNASLSTARDPALLAFTLIPTSIDEHCKGQHVRQALRESPIEGKLVVNKVHVKWSSNVQWEGGRPRFANNVVPFVFEKIPQSGYDVNGEVALKKGKMRKKE